MNETTKSHLYEKLWQAFKDTVGKGIIWFWFLVLTIETKQFDFELNF